jgi:hypothetical protein
MPDAKQTMDTWSIIAMGKLFAEGSVSGFFATSIPPVSPLLLAVLFKARHALDLPAQIECFKIMNLIFYGISIAQVHYFVRRQIEKPYAFAITALYALAPPTLNMLWSLDSQMTFMVVSMGTLMTIDWALSPGSELGGWLSQKEVEVCSVLLGLTVLTHQMGYVLLLAFFCILAKRFGFSKSISVIGTILLFLAIFIGRDVIGAVKDFSRYSGPSQILLSEMKSTGPLRVIQKYSDRSSQSLTERTIGTLNLSSFDAQSGGGNTSFNIAGNKWFRWILSAIAVMGAVYGLTLYTGIGTSYLTLYCLVSLLLLPHFNISLAPVTPLLLFSIYYGVRQLGQWFQDAPVPISRYLSNILTAWILLCSLSEHFALAQGGFPGMLKNMHRQRVIYMSTAQKPENRLDAAQDDSAHRRVKEWLKRHSLRRRSKEEKLVDSVQPLTLSDPSKRNDSSNMMPLPVQADSDIAAVPESEQSDFLVEENSHQLTPLKKGSSPASRGLKLVYEDVHGHIRIWQVPQH